MVYKYQCNITDEYRAMVHFWDNYTCQICGKKGIKRNLYGWVFAWEKVGVGFYEKAKYKYIRFHVDHIIDKALSGDDNPNNLRLLCKKCNLSRTHYRYAVVST